MGINAFLMFLGHCDDFLVQYWKLILMFCTDRARVYHKAIVSDFKIDFNIIIREKFILDRIM